MNLPTIAFQHKVVERYLEIQALKKATPEKNRLDCCLDKTLEEMYREEQCRCLMTGSCRAYRPVPTRRS